MDVPFPAGNDTSVLVAAGRVGVCDVVALQEVRVTAASALKAELVRIGLLHNTDSFSLAGDLSVLTGRRQHGELIASRWRVTALPPGAFPVPWTERILSAVIESPWRAMEIHTAHIPNGATNGWRKIETFEGIYRHLACRSDRPRILCGDFNSPQKEMSDGRLVTWGQDILPTGETVIKGTWRDRAGREDSNERWDLGERSVLEGLAVFDLAHVYRTLHGYGAGDFSWCWKGKGGTGRRFDHVFASRELNAVRSQYLHSLREAGLSDHSPIEVDFEPRKVDCGGA
jgi:endonuclease/exonuclease/phosphatase family metal-dependent hydrolase